MIRTRLFRTLILALTAALLLSCNGQDRTRGRADSSAGFVTLTDAVPDAILEIRYFSTYNFVGARVDGYLQPVALAIRSRKPCLFTRLRFEG